MTCEDYPCCGHEAGGCPTTNANGEQVFPCAFCGAMLPVHNRSALCDTCLRAGDPEDPDNECDCGECDECCGHDGEPNDDMDGDAASALASAGFGTDEDYDHDTPLGDAYGGE